jgi:hypothetical protein
LRAALMRTPFALWEALAGVAESLPHPLLTRNQVELMRIDTTASDNFRGVSRARNFAEIARRRTQFHAQAKQMRKLGKLRRDKEEEVVPTAIRCERGDAILSLVNSDAKLLVM